MAQRSNNGLGPAPTAGPLETVGVTVLPGVPMPAWAEAAGAAAVGEPEGCGMDAPFGVPQAGTGAQAAWPPPLSFDPAAVAQMDPAAVMAAFAALQAQASPVAPAQPVPPAQPLVPTSAPAGAATPTGPEMTAAPAAGAPQPVDPHSAWPTPPGYGAPPAVGYGMQAPTAVGMPPTGAPVGASPSPMAPSFAGPAGWGSPAAAAPAPAWAPPPPAMGGPESRPGQPHDGPVSAFALGAGGYPASPAAYPGNPMGAVGPSAPPAAGAPTGSATATAGAGAPPAAEAASAAAMAEAPAPGSPAAGAAAAGDAPTSAPGLTPEQLALVQRYAALVATGQIPTAQPAGTWPPQDAWQPPMAVGGSDPIPVPKHAKRRGLVALAVVGLVAVGLAGVAALMLPGLLGSEEDATSSGLRAPSAVGTLVAMTDPGMSEAVQTLIGMGLRSSGMTVTAAYGAQQTGSLAMAVMATRLRSSADARAQIDAWAQRVGTEVAEPVNGTGSAAGITCAAATRTSTAPAGSFCVWGDDGMRGNTFVVGSDPAAALQHTIAVRLAMAGSSQPAA